VKRLAVFCSAELTLLVDTVEKGKNEPIEIFACAPVETNSSTSNASQRPYEGHWLEIELIICPPTSFSDHGTGASEKIRSSPEKPFSTVSAHSDISRQRSNRSLLGA
jgi:hypothetical protein